MNNRAITAAIMATTADPRNRNHLPISSAKPKVGGADCYAEKRTVPYRQVIMPPRLSVLVAPRYKGIDRGKENTDTDSGEKQKRKVGNKAADPGQGP